MGSYGRYRRRGNPVVAVAVFAAFTVILGIVFTALSVQQVGREHDRAWSYQEVSFIHCRYTYTHKSTRHYECGVGDPTSGAQIYDGTTSVTADVGSGPPSDGDRWLHRVNGRIDDVGTAFPLWVWFFEIIPVAGLVFSVLTLRRSRRRRAGYGGQTPTGFGVPGYGPPQGFGQPTVTDQPGYQS